MLEFGARIRRPRLAIFVGVTLLLTACGGTQAPSAGSTPAASHAPNTTVKLSLQGTPPSSAAVGSTYSFQPTASVSGTGATFSMQGQPSWMSINATTGAVSGTPSANDQGQTPSITITLTDGVNSASIGPFIVSVEPAGAIGTGTAALSWTPPTINEDGTPIKGLTGYHVYYSTDPSSFDNAVEVTGASTTTYTVTGLNAGTYYFAVAAYNADGVESSMSNIGNKTI
jgi:hypothetical protein